MVQWLMSLSVKEILERLVVTSPTPPSLDQTRYSCSEYLILPYLKERRRSIVRITGDLLRSCVTPNWTCIVPALAHPKLFVSFSNFVQYAHSYAIQTYSNITINWQEEVRIPREFKNLASFKLPWFDSTSTTHFDHTLQLYIHRPQITGSRVWAHPYNA